MSGTITRIGTTGASALLALGIFAAPPAGATSPGGHGTNHETSACFTATGHTQGRSHSDPDGMSNGGADKPGCTGGFDADRDGNNGCGNDADREDDNNGRCGGPKRERVRDQHAAKTEVKAEQQDRDNGCHDKTATTTDVSATAAASGDSSEKCACPVGSEGTVTAPATVSAAAAGGAATDSAAASPDVAVTRAGATSATDIATVAAAGSTTAPDTQVLGESTTAPDTQVLGESITRPSALARTGAGVGGLALLGGLLLGGGRLTLLARRLLHIG
jgi:hypothetical protein